jgi:hypothetical protein
MTRKSGKFCLFLQENSKKTGLIGCLTGKSVGEGELIRDLIGK